MKVHLDQVQNALRTYARQVQKEKVEAVRKKTGETGPTQSRKKDEVSLSARAVEVRELQKVLERLPDVRAERVETLKKAVAEGKYHVDEGKVAEKMLARELVDRVQ